MNLLADVLGIPYELEGAAAMKRLPVRRIAVDCMAAP